MTGKAFRVLAAHLNTANPVLCLHTFLQRSIGNQRKLLPGIVRDIHINFRIKPGVAVDTGGQIEGLVVGAVIAQGVAIP